MKALVIIAACIAFAFILKVIDTFSNHHNLKSVGAKSNKESRSIPKIDITNPDELKKALEYYKDQMD